MPWFGIGAGSVRKRWYRRGREGGPGMRQQEPQLWFDDVVVIVVVRFTHTWCL